MNNQLGQKIITPRVAELVSSSVSEADTKKRVNGQVRWSSFFVTLTRKSFDIIMPAFSFQMVSYIHLMNVGGYDCNTHIHNS